MVFYNQVLGVSAYLCGIVFLLASIVDAVTDPLVGSLSDNFRSRWGRRHPFMLAAILPLALGFYLLYAPPGGMSEPFYFWWFLGTMVLLRVGKTFFAVPHDALGAELTDDYHERTAILGLNSVVGMIAGVLLAVFVFIVLFPSTEGYENGLLNPNGYPAMAIIGAAFLCVALLACVAGTRDQIPRLHDVERQRIRLRDNLGDLAALLRTRSYVSIFMAWLVMLVSFGILGVVGTYTFIWGFDLSTEEMSIQRFMMIPGMFAALPLAAWLTRRLDKKRTVILSSLVGATLVGLPHALRMIDFFPANDSMWLLPGLFGSLFVGFLILPVSTIVFDSQLADVADEHEYRTGRRAEGMIFSVRTFAFKATGRARRPDRGLRARDHRLSRERDEGHAHPGDAERPVLHDRAAVLDHRRRRHGVHGHVQPGRETPRGDDGGTQGEARGRRRRALSGAQSGRPSTRFATMLSCTSFVPPADGQGLLPQPVAGRPDLVGRVAVPFPSHPLRAERGDQQLVGLLLVERPGELDGGRREPGRPRLEFLDRAALGEALRVDVLLVTDEPRPQRGGRRCGRPATARTASPVPAAGSPRTDRPGSRRC